jgi:sulfotransferase family protein
VLPNLVVIGAMKCGTSSLHRYLSLHPDVSMSEQKELNYFEREWDRGREWYESQFPEPAAVRGESSPNYTKYPRHGNEAPARMHSLVPDARLIYLVRDPIDRIVSHYVDAYSFGRVSRPLLEELEGPEGAHFVNTSRYFMQLSRYLELFDRSRILVVGSEDLRDRRAEALSDVFRFLGVDDSFWAPEYDRTFNPGAEKRRAPSAAYAFERVVRRTRASVLGRALPRSLARPVRAMAAARSDPIEAPTIDAETRQRLADTLEKDVAELRRVTGLELASWSL